MRPTPKPSYRHSRKYREPNRFSRLARALHNPLYLKHLMIPGATLAYDFPRFLRRPLKGPEEVLVNVEKPAQVVVIKDATCTCEPEKPAPLLTRRKAIVIAGVGAAAGTGIGIALTRGKDTLPISPSGP